MSGWIKIDKTLETDPRVLRMAKALARRFDMFADGVDLDPCNAVALPGVTLVSGALVRLWIYADSHIREDDTLDLGTVEIDELLGVPGFCSFMPADWLQVIDDHTVELPGFQEHNGVEAIRKAQTAKRVAKHRETKKRDGVTCSNAEALPDQTRPDQDQTKTKVTRTPAREPSVLRGTSDFQADHDWALEVLRPLYPKPATDREWQFTARQIAALLGQGETRERLLQLAQDFLAQKRAENAGSQFIESPQKHYHPTEGKWGGPFALPTPAGKKTSVAARATWHPDNEAGAA